MAVASGGTREVLACQTVELDPSMVEILLVFVYCLIETWWCDSRTRMWACEKAERVEENREIIRSAECETVLPYSLIRLLLFFNLAGGLWEQC